MRRRALKVFAALAALLILTILTGVGYLYTKYPAVPPAETVTVAITPEKVVRGQYLFTNVAMCADCHSTRDWSKFSGPVTPGTLGRGGDEFSKDAIPGLPGRLHARNITPAAIGTWTDGEIIRAITTGVTKDNEALFPLMPYPNFSRMDREDVEAIVAYMRTLQPVVNHVPDRELDFPMALIVRTLPQPARFVTRPAESDKVAYGEYLVRTAGCRDCHTPTDAGVPKPGLDLAGGVEFRFPFGGILRTANITPDANTGIGAWSEEQFVERFKAFEKAPAMVLATADDQRAQQTVMPWSLYAGMKRQDLAAIYAYLRTQKPVIHRVEKRDTAVRIASR